MVSTSDQAREERRSSVEAGGRAWLVAAVLCSRERRGSRLAGVGSLGLALGAIGRRETVSTKQYPVTILPSAMVW